MIALKLSGSVLRFHATGPGFKSRAGTYWAVQDISVDSNKLADIVKFVNLQRLKWAGHLARMKEDRCCKKIFLAKPMGYSSLGRPLLRWIVLKKA
ncbi:hypothetical protein TNCV_3588581 [Trichonephila clavipes]|nr:hypothetical protein TNCV_3588581 [Trichonephila clavipes]